MVGRKKPGNDAPDPAELEYALGNVTREKATFSFLISFFSPPFSSERARMDFSFFSTSAHTPNHAVEPDHHLFWCICGPVEPAQWYSLTHPARLICGRSCSTGEMTGREYVGTQSPFLSYFSFLLDSHVELRGCSAHVVDVARPSFSSVGPMI